MTVWIIAIAMSVAATAILLLPLFLRRNRDDDPAAYDVEVYKDQLDQVGQDYDRGLMSAEQAQAAKTEISRRLLNADARRQAATGGAEEAGKGQTAMIAIIALAVPLGALGLYWFQGAPDIAGMPFAERASERTQTAAGAPSMDLEAAATQLSQRLEKNPGDLKGWLLLARTYLSMRRFPGAITAYEKALSLDAGNADITSSYGEALYFAAGEVVTPASRAAFEETLKKRPEDPRSRFYLALGDYQAGDKKKALEGWTSLVGVSPADASWLPAVRARIKDTAQSLGVAAVVPDPLPPTGDPPETKRTARGPSPADMEEAAALSPQERIARVRGMVEGLAAKLKNDPRDFQGWMYLIRSYAVLEENHKALDALAKARKIFEKAPVPMQRLTALAVELNLEKGETPRGPTEEQMKAGQDMSPEARQAMIGSMVARLAERLKENPDDLPGWTRLARSYTVLGKNDKAKDALVQALKIAPENLDLLILYGRTMRALNGDRSTPESLDAMRKVLAIEPTHVEALWFLGGAAADAGQKDEAKSLWERAIAQFPPGAPERAQLRARIDKLGEK